MTVLSKDNTPLRVLSVCEIATEESTYNIEVDEAHNYYVGLVGVLVHNSGFEDMTRSNVEIYVVRDASGKVVYVGQTVQGIDTRYNQHLGKGHPHWKNGYTKERVAGGNWTKYDAAVWERHYIDKHGGLPALENKVSPISEKKYKQFKHMHNPC